MEAYPTHGSVQSSEDSGGPVTPGSPDSPDDLAMETVSLEVEDDQPNQEILTLDTVKFEIEAEDGSAPRPIQSYFDDPKEVESEESSIFFDQVASKPEENRRQSAMLESYYGEDTVQSSDGIAVASFEKPQNPTIDMSAVADEERPSLVSTSCSETTEPEPELDNKQSKDLSKFFEDEKHGSDTIGKAFFDALAQTISDADQTSVANLQILDSSLRTDDCEDYYCAWIPKSTTKQALLTMASTPPGTYFLEKENLTMPGVIMTEELRDQIRDLARQYLADDVVMQRVTLTADNVSQDEEGLTKLINVGCFRAAINLTTRILTNHGQGLKRAGHPSRNSAQSLQIWLVRLSLLLKLRLFNMAEAESEPFGDLDRPDLYFEFCPEVYGSRQGCMAPFAFRILLTQILTCVGKFGEALDRLYAILSTVTKIIKNLESGKRENGNADDRSLATRQASVELWEKREVKVLYTITNCLVAQNDFFSAYTLLDMIVEKMPQDEANIRSAQGHVLLQLGDIKLAQASFALAANARRQMGKDKVATLLDKALMCISHNNFADAFSVLKEAQELDANNPTVINNMAVCLLYMGKLRDSFQLLENAIAKNPKTFLHECVLVNICTLYDLESSRSLQKKRGMLEVVCNNAGDGFNVFCLKLQSMS